MFKGMNVFRQGATPVAAPVGHQVPALFENVSAMMRCLGFVADSMRQVQPPRPHPERPFPR